MTTAYSSFGTLVQLGTTDDDTSASFTTVANVRDITGPAMTTDVEDATNQSSPGGFEEIIPTIKHAGELSFDVLLDPSDPTHDEVDGLFALQDSRELRAYRVVLPTNPARQWKLKGYVIAVSSTAPVAGLLTASITIRISGQPTLATV